MEQAGENLKILLIRTGGGDLSPWVPLVKALKTFCQVEEREFSADFNLESLAEEFSQVFLDVAVAQSLETQKLLPPNFTIVATKPPEFPAKPIPLCATECPSLVLAGISTTDLVRITHLFVSPKKLAGVSSMIEKGGLILAEKIQGIDAVGSLIDKLMMHLKTIDGFSLGARLLDLRQVLSALIFKAFEQTAARDKSFPTTEIQVGVTKTKIVVNLRFPSTKTRADILRGNDVIWRQALDCSDVILVTEHQRFSELEFMMCFLSQEKKSPAGLSSLLWKRVEKSAQKESYFNVSGDYKFKVISDIRLRDAENKIFITAEDESIDLGSLPDKVVKKIGELEKQSEDFKIELERKNGLLGDLTKNNLTQAAQINKQKIEISSLKKNFQLQTDALQKKVSSLEESLATAIHSKKQPQADTQVENKATSGVNLEATVRSLENEKNQINERYLNEQKKFTLLEQKYSTLYKESAKKEVEIQDLKAQLLKAKKESTMAAQEQGSKKGGDKESDNASGKIKEGEQREAALKQEIKKLAFKIENQEKNSKVVLQENAEKLKLLEQKLQGAKAKEVDLLKKIDDLSSALKKASKAA